MEKDPRVESAVRKMVRRRQTQYLRKLSGSTFNRPAPEQGSNYLGRRTRRQPHPHLPAVASRGLPLRECAQTKQDQEGRPDHYLSPEHPRGRDAMLACARIGAVHSVIFGGFSADSIRDRITDSGAVALITADGAYRRGG